MASVAIGERFTRLEVVAPTNSSARCRSYVCRCDCGKEVNAFGSALASGHTKSCGCLYEDSRTLTNHRHGMAGTPEHQAWVSMRQRCENSRASGYARYGGRGIRVCDRWQAFEPFLADMGLRPSEAYSLDRIDVNGDYTPDNCRWAIADTQNNNKRVSHYLEFQGRRMTVNQWARHLGCSSGALHWRLSQGKSVDEVLGAPVREPERLLTHRGESKSVTEWAKKLGVSRSLLFNRLQSGWTVERALSTPAPPKRRQLT